MLGVQSNHVEVYVFRRRGRRVEFLALRRSRDRVKLPGVWQPVTGKLDPGEIALASAVREVAEETGLTPVRWWALETVTVYVEQESLVVLPLFAAEARADARVRLSEEHDAFAFVSAAQAARRYLWEAQRRGLEAVRREVLGRRDLAAALEITDQVHRRATSAAGLPAGRSRSAQGVTPTRRRAASRPTVRRK